MDNLEHLERRHFTLPAAFVLTLLAFLFFGMTNPTRTTVTAAPPVPPHKLWPAAVINIVEPPPPDAPDDAEPLARPIKEGGGQQRPTILDEPRPVGPKDFVVPVEPQRLQPTGLTDMIGDVGLPPSDDGKLGSGKRGVTSWTELDQPPRTRVQTSPVYPTREKSTGTTGRVEVEFTVDETGAVVNPRSRKCFEVKWSQSSPRSGPRNHLANGTPNPRLGRWRNGGSCPVTITAKSSDSGCACRCCLT